MSARFQQVITRDPSEVAAAQRLRGRVFQGEMGAGSGRGDAPEADSLDDAFDHLVIRDLDAPDVGVVATARLGLGARYTSGEFDLSRLQASGAVLAETGRTCIHPDYRGGIVGLMLFAGTLRHLRGLGARYLVGTASFPGADPAPHMDALRRLQQEALAPDAIRPFARGPEAVAVTGAAPRAAMRGVPALIKAYLRAGAMVGEGAWQDAAFNCLDVCILVDLTAIDLGPLDDRIRRLADG